jgi:hypothetical protein
MVFVSSVLMLVRALVQSLFKGFQRVDGHCVADQRSESVSVNRLALKDNYGAAHSALTAGVEQDGRVFQRRPFVKQQLHLGYLRYPIAKNTMTLLNRHTLSFRSFNKIQAIPTHKDFFMWLAIWLDIESSKNQGLQLR